MGLDITIYKAKTKEWNDFSNGEEIDWFAALHNEYENFPNILFLGEFCGVVEFTYLDGVDNCIFAECTKEDLKNLFYEVNENEQYDYSWKVCFNSWFVAVYNTLEDDETLLVVCDW